MAPGGLATRYVTSRGRCIARANSVVSNRQARAATKAYIKEKLQMDLTDGEKRSLEKQAA
jgi:hypothetical protein